MDNQKKSYRTDELTLGEVIDIGGLYLKGIQKNIFRILILSGICALASFFYYHSKPPLYKARLSFMLNDDESSQMSNVSAILGQFGLPIMNQRINISKVLELSLSRKIIQNAIFNKIETLDGSDFIANHIIKVYSLDDEWTTETRDMSEFRFFHANVDSFGLKENVALRALAKMIAGTPANRQNALLESDYGQNTTIMSFVTHSEDEAISYYLTKAVFDATSDFYVEKSIETQAVTYKVLSTKRDSLLEEYNKLESVYTSLSDRSSGLFSNKMDIKKDRARSEMLQLSSGLAKLEEQLSLVSFGIENNTPILQVIDSPILPLEEVRTGRIKSILIGLGFGLLLGFCVVIFFEFSKLLKQESLDQ